MKKIFTLIAIALFGGASLSAQTEVDIPLDNWGWGWNCSTSYENGILTGEITGGYGAVSTGWGEAQNWTAYSKITAVIESYGNDWGKFYFQDSAGDAIAEQTFSTIGSTTNVTIMFDGIAEEKLKDVKQLAVQCKDAGDIIKVSRVYLTEAEEYEATGKEVVYDEWGNILASEFEGFSDKAKVVFTYTTTGELTNDQGSVVGWGTGSITSIDNEVKVADVPVKALGDNELVFTIADLKDALASGPDQYGRKGLYWNMYAQGNSTSTRKSIVIYEVKDLGTSVNAIEIAKPVQNDVIYNLAGQKVDAGYKGIVIKNGKKIVVK